MTSPVRVVKLGGSLLDWPELIPNLRRWLAAQTPARDVLIVGGGQIVEQIRALDRLQALPEETAHWLCVQAMSLTAQLLHAWLPEAELVTSLADSIRTAEPGPRILDVDGFLHDDVQSKTALPCTWQVTSDSIAARVATTVEAIELVLLKSTLPAVPATLESCANAGIVDSYFPKAAAGLSVRMVNFRDRRHTQITLT